jgi:Fic family protein
MMYQSPRLLEDELAVIDAIKSMRETLRYAISSSARWTGILRRATLARNIRGSNSIEGIVVSRDDAMAAVAEEEPLTAERGDWQATVGYRNAMTYVLQLAADPHFRYSADLLRGLHFMMVQYDLSKNPGRWRPGIVYVRDEEKQQTVYEAPPAEDVAELIEEMCSELNAQNDQPALVRAAMGHLNLVMIHPFSDGNGRMARCMQTLILAREMIIEAPFCSIEEYLGRFTQDYYEVLAKTGQGGWHPENDCREWIRFNLTAHYRQAHWLLQRSRITQLVWNEIEETVLRLGLPDRTMLALVDAAFGYTVRNATYRKAAQLPELTAGRDLKILLEAGLLEADGATRGRVYRCSLVLKEIYLRHYEKRQNVDPFETVPTRQMSFPRQ